MARLHSFSDLVDLQIADIFANRKPPPPPAKAAALATIKRDLGKEKIGHVDRHKLIKCGRKRSDEGAGPMTLGTDIGVIKMILSHSVAVHGPEISAEGVDLARMALKHVGLIGKGIERDRRPTTVELSRLVRCLNKNARLMPMRIVQFAVALGLRREENCRASRSDLDRYRRMRPTCDRKDPRNKAGNDQWIRPLTATWQNDCTLVMAQAKRRGKAEGPALPCNSGSVETACCGACADADVNDPQFRGLRQEGTSQLSEVGLSIEQAALWSKIHAKNSLSYKRLDKLPPCRCCVFSL